MAIMERLPEVHKVYLLARAARPAADAWDAALWASFEPLEVEEIRSFLSGALDRDYGQPGGQHFHAMLVRQAEDLYQEANAAGLL